MWQGLKAGRKDGEPPGAGGGRPRRRAVGREAVRRHGSARLRRTPVHAEAEGAGETPGRGGGRGGSCLSCPLRCRVLSLVSCRGPVGPNAQPTRRSWRSSLPPPELACLGGSRSEWNASLSAWARVWFHLLADSSKGSRSPQAIFLCMPSVSSERGSRPNALIRMLDFRYAWFASPREFALSFSTARAGDFSLFPHGLSVVRVCLLTLECFAPS